MAKTSFKERQIETFLNSNRIPFIREYSFPGLKSSKGKLLRFDFALITKSGVIRLIEYQGQQHYDKKHRWYTKGGVVRDRQKVDYCKKNHIPLLILNKDNYDVKLIREFYYGG